VNSCSSGSRDRSWVEMLRGALCFFAVMRFPGEISCFFGPREISLEITCFLLQNFLSIFA
jgi:hypothetical protein